MTLPGTTIISRTSPPARSATADTGAWFVAGVTEKGAVADAQVAIGSLAEYTSRFGARVTYGVLYDALDVFFREGGAKAYVSRVFGPSPVAASHTFNDGSAVSSLIISAGSPGVWGNNLRVQITAGDVSGYKIVVTDTVLGAIATSPDLADQAAALAWEQAVPQISIALGSSVSNPAVVAAQALTGGTDDHANATDATWKAALDQFGADLGPGQVSMPGRTTDIAHTDALSHAGARNRYALLDGPDTAAKATLITSATNAKTANGRYGMLWAPWAVVPGLTPGTVRTVPFSAVEAGLIARSDGIGNNPNVAAAGDNGQAQYAIGLSQAAWIDADREALNDACVNVAIMKYGGVRAYGFRALVNPTTDATWLQATSGRLNMAIASAAGIIGERFVFDQLDGRRHSISQFGGELAGMLAGFWEDGALYGSTPDEAFAVDVGPQINTDTTIAAGELHAVLAVRMSPFAERVIIEVVKIATTEAVS